MTNVGSLGPNEWAKQLCNPEGEVGLAVMNHVYESNARSSVQAVASLAFKPGSHVLEVGFGGGRMALEVLSQGNDVQYTGLDLSPTMVAEADRFNRALVDARSASFHLGSAEQMPFPSGAFDYVFSIGVAHFWSVPLRALLEIHRVLRPAGVSMLGCLQPGNAPPFARPENGFYLRDAKEWAALHGQAGFVDIHADEIETEQVGATSPLVKRRVLKVEARA